MGCFDKCFLFTYQVCGITLNNIPFDHGLGLKLYSINQFKPRIKLNYFQYKYATQLPKLKFNSFMTEAVII